MTRVLRAEVSRVNRTRPVAFVDVSPALLQAGRHKQRAMLRVSQPLKLSKI
jgi:hypothetical protein